MRVHSKAERWFDVVNYTVLATLAFVCFYPFVMMTVLSINAGTDSMRGGITLWPRVFTLVNYRVILENAAIQRAYVVTVMRTAIGTAGGVFVTAGSANPTATIMANARRVADHVLRRRAAPEVPR